MSEDNRLDDFIDDTPMPDMGDDGIEPDQLLGHPKGLFFLFFAELWERFSFYGMRALLTLYLVKQVFSELGKEDADEKAIGIYAAYGALVYATPLIGGMFADKIIGYRKSIMLGAILMALGHFVMAFESQFFLFTALGLLIVGNGFFKPNISSLVGSLYKQGDARRDAGFTIFYLGINLGAFLAPLACGYLGETYGWHYGFGLAGIGMVAGLFTFWGGARNGVFGNRGLQPKEYQTKKFAGLNIEWFVYLFAFALVPISALLVANNDIKFGSFDIMSLLLLAVLAVAMIVVAFIFFTAESNIQRGRIAVILFITLLLTVFWAFFEQAGSSLTLFAERNVNLTFLNASQTNSINPGYIMIFAIPFSIMWAWLSARRLNPPTPVKYAMGIAQLGLGFLVFALSAHAMDATGKVPIMYLMFGYLLITTGELFVSPIGLSKVTELSPKKSVAFFMGVFFLSSAFAHYIAGAIAKLTSGGSGDGPGDMWVGIIEKVTGFAGGVAPDGSIEAVSSLATYTGVFTQIAVISLIVAFFTLLVSPIVKKLMGGIH